MKLFSIAQIPIARSYFLAGKDIILELYDDFAALIPINTTVEFTGNTTNGSLTILNIADTSLLVVGQVVEGAGIPAGSKIDSKAANSITIDQLATVTASTVSMKAFTLCTPGVDDTSVYWWSFANITTQPSESLSGYWRARTSDNSYPETRTDFQWGGWPDKTTIRFFPFPSDETQSVARVKGDNIDFIFDFEGDVSGWQFMFTLIDPNGTFELKKGSSLVSGGGNDQISVEISDTFSRVIAKVLKDETGTFAGTDGNYELQFITNDDKIGTTPGTIVFKEELIDSSWVLP